MPITLDGTNGITTPTYGGADTSEYLVPVTQFKNRLINSAMVIDQRNAGASVTPTSDATYTLDRWCIRLTQSSKVSVQQNASSIASLATTGFNNYLGVTSTSSYSITSSDIFTLAQHIEGNNVQDLAWGTASAKTVTLSFWVYSSKTGTFGGSVFNNAANRSYPFTFTVSSTNTWEQKSVTIPGDTSGSWTQTTGVGIYLNFDLGSGTSRVGTAGAWAGTTYWGASGCQSIVATNGATFYITGVQLEVGSTATSFDYRPYQQELALCQRYYVRFGSPLNTIAGGARLATGTCTTASACAIPIYLPVSLRSAPTVGYSGINIANASNDTALTSVSGVLQLNNLITADYNTGGGMSGLGQIKATGSTAYIDYSSEL